MMTFLFLSMTAANFALAINTTWGRGDWLYWVYITTAAICAVLAVRVNYDLVL